MKTEQHYLKEEINNLEKIRERLKGYACGYHKQLDKQIKNRISKLKSRWTDIELQLDDS